jgi:Zn-dependent protease
VFGVGLILAIFGCVVLHEFGHALAARAYGIATRDITLYPIGGVARLDRMSEDPDEEIVIALAGPAVNVVIAFGLGMGLALGGYSLVAGPASTALGAAFVHQLLVANVILVLFNLVPAFPMDGGRVLRAFLAKTYGRLRATEIATQVGMVALVGIGLFGWLSHNYMMLPLAVVIYLFGQQELAAVRYLEARRAEPAAWVPAEYVIDPRAVPAEPGFSGFTWDHTAGLWIEWRDGRPVAASGAVR